VNEQLITFALPSKTFAQNNHVAIANLEAALKIPRPCEPHLSSLNSFRTPNLKHLIYPKNVAVLSAALNYVSTLIDL